MSIARTLRVAVWWFGPCVVGCLIGCGSESAAAADEPWGKDVTVIGPDGSESNFAAPEDDKACVNGQGKSCIRTQDACGAGVPADVLVDAEGQVIDVVCYPTSGTLTPEQIEAQNGDVVQNQNGAVVVLDGAADGVDLVGNLALDANRVVVYGEGPDVSVISGNLTVDGNNSIVRGIRTLGSLDVVKNDAVLLFCVIEGDVSVVGNNTRLSGCDIYGSVRIEGDNTVLSSNRIQGKVDIVGNNSSCHDNLTFQDTNADRRIADTEVGAPLGCGKE